MRLAEVDYHCCQNFPKEKNIKNRENTMVMNNASISRKNQEKIIKTKFDGKFVIYLVGCHFVGVLRIRFLLGFVSGTLPTRTRPRFENTYGFPREFTPENNKKNFVKLKGVLRIIASKFYEVLT